MQEHPAEPVPHAIRNAPTPLMNELGYGRDYVYAPDTEEGVGGLDCLPDAVRGQRFYQPTEHGFEAELRRRSEQLDALRERLRSRARDGGERLRSRFSSVQRLQVGLDRGRVAARAAVGVDGIAGEDSAGEVEGEAQHQDRFGERQDRAVAVDVEDGGPAKRCAKTIDSYLVRRPSPGDDEAPPAPP